MKRKILFITSIIALTCVLASCQRDAGTVLDFVRKGQESQEDPFARCRDRIVREAIEEFYSEVKLDQMTLIGIGGGINHANQKKNYIELVFATDKGFTVDAARKLMVSYINRFLNILNSKEGIQEYIDVYPFDMAHLEIGFLSRDGEEGCVDMISALNNRIYYEFSNASDKPPILVHKETFEEAQRIVAEEKQIESQCTEIQTASSG